MNTRKRVYRTCLSCLLSLALLLPVLIGNTTTAMAATHSSGLVYTSNTNMEAVITGFNDNTAKNLIIPDKINGLRVVGIADRSFYRKTNLKTVQLPRTLRSIGKQAFSLSGLTEITVPGSVKTIDTAAFAQCRSLKKVKLLYGIETIGDGAFSGCTSLETVEMGASANFGGGAVFENVQKEIEIQTPTTSSVNGFTSSTGEILTFKRLANNSECAYKYVVDPDTGEVVIEGYFGDSLTPVIPNTILGDPVTKIEDNAFADKRVDKVTLPDSLKEIGSGVFSGTGLKEITIPSTVTGIGEVAFDDDPNLVIKGSCPALDEYLKNCKKIKFVPYGPGAELYHQVKFVANPTGGGTITQGVTRDYRSGTKVTIAAVPKQTEYLFDGWSSSLGDNSIFIESKASVTEMTVPGKDVIISANFGNIPPEPLVIRNGIVIAYYGAGPEVNIPTEYGKTGQQDPNKVPVTEIGSYSTLYTYGRVFHTGYVETLKIPQGITKITDNAFYGASSLKKIIVANNNENFSTDSDGVLYNKDKSKLICYPAGITAEEYTVPSTVTSIGAYAFAGNTHIKKINLNNVKSIGIYAFTGCSNLREITTEMLETIGNYAFEYCTSINKLTLPDSIQSIGSYAFRYCSSLADIVWPAQCPITTIESGTFFGCAFAEMNIPNYITTVRSYSFGSNSKLTAVTVPASVTSFASDALFDSRNLAKVLVGQGNTKYESFEDILFTIGKTELMIYPPSKPGAEYTVPELTNKIGDGAFAYSKVPVVDLANVTIIGNRAFLGSGITAIDLEHVVSIGTSAFKYCNGLTEVTIPAIGQIPFELLEYSINLNKVIIPDSVTSINSWAFNGCYNLTDIVLPNSLISIGSYAFNGCSKLVNITLPSNLKTIGSYAFSSCIGLTEVNIPESVETIGEYAYSGCSQIAALTFDNCNATIGNYAFYRNIALTQLTIPSTISSVGAGAFTDAKILKTLSISSKTIGNSAFSGCVKLDTLTLGEGVETIGTYAFDSCLINQVIIPKETTSIGIRAFRGNPVESYGVKEGNTKYIADKESLYTIDGETLVMYPSHKEADSYTTLETVKKIQSYAFENADKLNSITFAENTATLQHSLFVNCDNIKTVKVLNREAVFENLIASPYEYVFYGVNNIAKIMVRGYSGSTTEKEVFKHRNQNLHFAPIEENYDGVIVDLTGRVVGYSGNQTKVSIPSSVSIDTVGVTIVNNNKEFKTVELQEALKDGKILTVTRIGASAFENPFNPDSKFYSTITGVDIPMSVTKIESYAFADCTALTKEGLVLPDSIESIAAFSFANCTGLTEVTIPKGAMIVNEDGLQDIGVDASVYVDVFYGCTNLERIKVAEGNRSYYSDNGVLMNIAKDKIYAVPNALPGDVGNPGTYTMPNSVLSVGTNAFSNSKLTNIIFSNQLEVIRKGAFENAFPTGNVELNLPNSLVELQNRAFIGCKGLTKITIPAALERIGDNVFNGCINLNTLNVAEGNRQFVSINGILYAYVSQAAMAKQNTTSGAALTANVNYGFSVALVRCPAAVTSVDLPADGSLVQIYSGAFADCSRLSEITLPEGLTLIGQYAFSDCGALRSVAFPSTLISIGANAFAGTSLVDIDLEKTELEIIDAFAFAGRNYGVITLPETLKVIGESAFEGHNADHIVVPQGVQEIGDNSFTPDSKSNVFRSVTINGENTILKGDPFGGSNIIIRAPYGSKAHQFVQSHSNLTFESTTSVPESPEPSPAAEESEPSGEQPQQTPEGDTPTSNEAA